MSHIRHKFLTGLWLAMILPASWVLAAGQKPQVDAPDTAKANVSLGSPGTEVESDWAVSWEGRLGTEQGVFSLRQTGNSISGTFQDGHGVSPVSGAVEKNRISLDVHFSGARPYTIRFTGTAAGAKIMGTSQAVGIGGSGAYLGHAGEVVQPEHPWTAQRSNQRSNISH